MRHAGADVVAIGLLQALDGLGVLQQRDLPLQRGELGLQDRNAAVLVDHARVRDDRVAGPGNAGASSAASTDSQRGWIFILVDPRRVGFAPRHLTRALVAL